MKLEDISMESLLFPLEVYKISQNNQSKEFMMIGKIQNSQLIAPGKLN